MPFNEKQITQLLAPINPKRVLRDGKGNAHVSQQDVTGHLTRIFGFGGWAKKVISVELIYETPRNEAGTKWDVAYKALVKLTVRDEFGNDVTSFEDGSVGVAQNQSRGDAHDLAYKSAISLSTKRAAKDLGDQFGLSLYNKGQMTALVGATLVGLAEDGTVEVQAHVEQQVSLGNDEIDREPDPADKARDELRDMCSVKGWPLAEVAASFSRQYGVQLKDADVDAVTSFSALLSTGAVTV